MLLLPLIFFCFLTFTTTIGAPGVGPSKPSPPPEQPPVLEGPEGPEGPVDRVNGHFVHPENLQPSAEVEEILILQRDMDPDDLTDFVKLLKGHIGDDNVEALPPRRITDEGVNPRLRVRWTEEQKKCWYPEPGNVEDNIIVAANPFYTLFLIAFKDGISEDAKKNYVKTKSEERRKQMHARTSYDTLELDNEILAMVALIPPKEISSWQDEVVDFIWQESDTFQEIMDPFNMPIQKFTSAWAIINTPLEGKERPTGKLLYQASPRDLGMISKLRKDTQPLDEKSFQRFEFLDWAGIDQIVHVHSEGVNAQHRESRDLTGTLTLLNYKWKAGLYFRKLDKSLYAMGTDGHNIVSHITGNSLGVAKHPSVRIIPSTIVEDVRELRKKQENYVPVICLPYQIQFPEGDGTQKLVNLLEKYFRAMVEEDAFISVGGFFNDGSLNSPKTDKAEQPRYPAAFARKDEFKKNMIVAGTANLKGELFRNSQNSLVDVTAPGQAEIRCPKLPPTRDKFYANSGATEFISLEGGAARSTPAYIAGLAAYYLSLDSKLDGGALVAERIRKRHRYTKNAMYANQLRIMMQVLFMTIQQSISHRAFSFGPLGPSA